MRATLFEIQDVVDVFKQQKVMFSFLVLWIFCGKLPIGFEKSSECYS